MNLSPTSKKEVLKIKCLLFLYIIHIIITAMAKRLYACFTDITTTNINANFGVHKPLEVADYLRFINVQKYMEGPGIATIEWRSLSDHKHQEEEETPPNRKYIITRNR